LDKFPVLVRELVTFEVRLALYMCRLAGNLCCGH